LGAKFKYVEEGVLGGNGDSVVVDCDQAAHEGLIESGGIDFENECPFNVDCNFADRCAFHRFVWVGVKGVDAECWIGYHEVVSQFVAGEYCAIEK
jgi:hypothetical protein